MPPVEPVVAVHLHPNASFSSLVAALPSRANRYQSNLTWKASRAVVLAAHGLKFLSADGVPG